MNWVLHDISSRSEFPKHTYFLESFLTITTKPGLTSLYHWFHFASQIALRMTYEKYNIIIGLCMTNCYKNTSKKHVSGGSFFRCAMLCLSHLAKLPLDHQQQLLLKNIYLISTTTETMGPPHTRWAPTSSKRSYNDYKWPEING